MARIQLEVGEIRRWARGEMLARARLTLRLYRKSPLKRDNPAYPFARHPEDESIRSPQASSIKPTARGVRITVASRGAPFIEEGNDDVGSVITGNMAIPLRRKRKPGGRVFIGEDGRAYLGVQRVKTYRGRQLLLQAASRAYTGRPLGGPRR